MSDGLNEGYGEPLEEWDERPLPEGGGPETPKRRLRDRFPVMPWSKLSWVAIAIVCGVTTSLLSSPQGLVAAFRAQPNKIIGKEEGPDTAEPGKVVLVPGKGVQVDESAPNRLRFAQVGDVVAQQSDQLGVETVDPAPVRRDQRRIRDEPPVGTVVTVPTSQGRLLRFDEAVESVFIADPSIADVRVVAPDVVYVYGKRTGLTNLMAVSGGGGQKLSASVLLRVVTDVRPAREGLQELNPGAADNIEVSIFGRRAAIAGNASNIDQAIDAQSLAQTYSPPGLPPLNRTTIDGANQVNIRVRFAEVQRNDLQSFGIDWNISGGSGSFQFGVAKSTGGGISGVPSTGGTTTSLNPNLGFGVRSEHFNAEVLIEALKRNGMLHVLAEPNLTAVTGETASFLAGGEVPVPVPQGGNSDAVTVQYKPFGVSLNFTPTVIRPNRIGLKVKPEVSSISTANSFTAAGFSLPSFTVRRAETTVEVASGQTFAIAGLFQRDVSRNIEKLPVLGDVPILGQLFTSERYLRNETELVILITPYMVEPVRDDKLVTPLDREGPSPWQASVVDPTSKGATLTKQPDHNSGFIFK